MLQSEAVKAWMIALLLIAGALCWTAECRAALEWQTKEERLKAEVGQEKAVAVFPFRNAGGEPVRIMSVEPSCGCMVAKPEKEVYAAGESGEIRAEINLAGRAGVQNKSITVTTDDDAGKTTVLSLVVDVPEPLVIKPRFLFWKTGEEPEEKTAEITVTDPSKITLGGFESNNPSFEVRLEKSAGDGRYRLRIKPEESRAGAATVIRLNATVAGKPQSFVVYAAVK